MKLNSKEFKKLQSKWYSKLKESGFVDAERDEKDLKWAASSSMKQAYTNHGELGVESNTEYFRLAGLFLHDHKFESKMEEIIWEYHAQGESVRDISKLLKPRGYFVSYVVVHRYVQKTKALMFKEYKIKEESDKDNG